MASFKQTIKLVQQTPMIHFQAERANDGTLLRATEVKPKLDRFIYEWFRVKNGEELPKEWRISEEHKALDYKLRFDAGGKSYRLAEPAPHYSAKKPGPWVEETGNLYFGNISGKKNDGKKNQPKRSLFYKTPISMTILCFHPKLLEVIEDCLDTFFLTVNFGTRQNKGFGGFVTEKVAQHPEEGANRLEFWYRETSGTPVYRIVYNVCNFPPIAANDPELRARAILRDISAIYQTLKSGFNFSRYDPNNPPDDKKDDKDYIKSFLTKYFWKKNVSGEKRYMKVKGIAPIKNRDPERKLTPEEKDAHREYRYIRGLLGASGQQEWQTDLPPELQETRGGRKITKERITFECAETEDSKLCARIPSPIFFKVVGTTLYIVPYEPLDKIYGVQYRFLSKRPKGKDAKPISIPTKEEFGSMKELFDEYVKALNGELQNDDTRKKLLGLSGKLKLSFLSRESNLKIEKCGG